MNPSQTPSLKRVTPRWAFRCVAAAAQPRVCYGAAGTDCPFTFHAICANVSLYPGQDGDDHMSEQTDQPAQKWAYHTFTVEPKFQSILKASAIDYQELNRKLNRLGQLGWELVSVMDTNWHEGRTRELVAVMKRPVD